MGGSKVAAGESPWIRVVYIKFPLPDFSGRGPGGWGISDITFPRTLKTRPYIQSTGNMDVIEDCTMVQPYVRALSHCGRFCGCNEAALH